MNLNTEHVTIFKHDDWLSKTMGNSKRLTCELGAEVDGKKLVNGKSKVPRYPTPFLEFFV